MSHGFSRFIGQRFLVFLQQLLLEGKRRRTRCGRLNGDAIASAMVRLARFRRRCLRWKRTKNAGLQQTSVSGGSAVVPGTWPAYVLLTHNRLRLLIRNAATSSNLSMNTSMVIRTLLPFLPPDGARRDDVRVMFSSFLVGPFE
jgi:hypothetical protein